MGSGYKTQIRVSTPYRRSGTIVVGRTSSHRPRMADLTKSELIFHLTQVHNELARIIASAQDGLTDEAGPAIIPLTDPVYTFAEVAKLTGVSEPTVRRLVSEGKIRRTSIGNSPRVLRSDLKDYRLPHGIGATAVQTVPRPGLHPLAGRTTSRCVARTTREASASSGV